MLPGAIATVLQCVAFGHLTLLGSTATLKRKVHENSCKIAFTSVYSNLYRDRYQEENVTSEVDWKNSDVWNEQEMVVPYSVTVAYFVLFLLILLSAIIQFHHFRYLMQVQQAAGKVTQSSHTLYSLFASSPALQSLPPSNWRSSFIVSISTSLA